MLVRNITISSPRTKLYVCICSPKLKFKCFLTSEWGSFLFLKYSMGSQLACQFCIFLAPSTQTYKTRINGNRNRIIPVDGKYVTNEPNRSYVAYILRILLSSELTTKGYHSLKLLFNHKSNTCEIILCTGFKVHIKNHIH